MQTDFTKIDKSDFKCLKNTDGSIYYGQLVTILPQSEPKPENLSGFRQVQSRQPSADPLAQASHARSEPTQNSALDAPETEKGDETLIVENIDEISEELRAKLIQVRHGYGIQIYADSDAKYAGEWVFDIKHGDGHQVFSDGSEYRGQFNQGKFDGYGHFKWPSQD